MSAIESGPPFANSEIALIERTLRRRLPDSYRRFVMEHGGAFVGGSLDGGNEYSVLAFDSAAQINHSFKLLPEYSDDGMLIFAHCELGGIYVINRDDSIWYRVVWSGKVTSLQVANSFEEFRDRIVIRSDDELAGELK